MFKPKNQRVENLVKKLPHLKVYLQAVENLFVGNTGIYIDYANVRPWAAKLKWNIDLNRLNVFLNSFDNVKAIKFFDGVLEGDRKSERESKVRKRIFKSGFNTKPVKIMKHYINYTSIKPNSTDLLEKFIRKCLLREYETKTIKYLNGNFKQMNQKGIYCIEDRKCNFDVEIGTAMMLDLEHRAIDTFALWSGDSDFFDPISKILSDGKRVVLFATSGKVSRELNDLRKDGLEIFDIKKIREFICWGKQI